MAPTHPHVCAGWQPSATVPLGVGLRPPHLQPSRSEFLLLTPLRKSLSVLGGTGQALVQVGSHHTWVQSTRDPPQFSSSRSQGARASPKMGPKYQPGEGTRSPCPYNCF